MSSKRYPEEFKIEAVKQIISLEIHPLVQAHLSLDKANDSSAGDCSVQSIHEYPLSEKPATKSFW